MTYVRFLLAPKGVRNTYSIGQMKLPCSTHILLCDENEILNMDDSYQTLDRSYLYQNYVFRKPH